jgi:hypothetical protein
MRVKQELPTIERRKRKGRKLLKGVAFVSLRGTRARSTTFDVAGAFL